MSINQLVINRSDAARSTEPVWVNALGVAFCVLLLLATAYWSVVRSGQSLRANTASKLETVLKIESEAVRQWMVSERQLAGLIADDAKLAELMQTQDSESISQKVDQSLASLSQKLGNKTCLLMTIDGRVIASSGESWLLKTIKTLEDQFCETLTSGEPTSSPVLPSVGGDGKAIKYSMVFAAPIQNEEQQVVGFLGIGHDLQAELTSVLASSRSGKSGETIAVTRDGELISKSRFSEGENPLSFFAQDQQYLANRTDVRSATIVTDLQGQPDQRGVVSVVSSRWLPEVGLGIVTKMDRAEANAPVNQILYFVWTLFALVLVTALSTLFYRWYLFRMRVAARKRELESKRLGAYELGECIGEGGMGVVYEAKHALMRRPTAVKILPPEKSNAESIQRFEREVQFTSQLKHPNTISIFDYGRTETGLFYYAMELLDGLNLEQLVQVDGPVQDGRVIHILRQIAESLREAHHQGLIHRDIKPSNIMLCDRGGALDTVKVLDFGMVRQSAAVEAATLEDAVRQDNALKSGPTATDSKSDNRRALSGTPSYMAPECFTAPQHVDARADVFAVGAVAFFLLTGERLFDVQTLNQLFQVHQSDLVSNTRARIEASAESSRLNISPPLIDLVARCVDPSRDQRPESVDAVLSDLNECQPMQPWSDLTAFNWWGQNDLNSTRLTSSNGQTSGPVNSLSLQTTQAFDHSNYQAKGVSLDRFVECKL